MPDMMLGPYKAFLFDMDGTLLTSRAAIERVWKGWSARWGLDAAEVSGFLHGRRAKDAIDYFLPHLDAKQHATEVDWVERREMEDTEGVVEVPGAAAFLATLPADRWSIVTSAARRLALCRIKATGLPVPAFFISADDVVVSKPDPSGDRRAAALLEAPVDACLVFEDAPPGIRAGLASGADVIVVGSDPGSQGYSVQARIPSFAGLLCNQGSDGTLHVAKHQDAAKSFRRDGGHC